MRDGWRETTLGEVASRVIGRTPKRKEPRYWTDDLSLPFFTIADMHDRRVTTGREGVTQQAVADGQAKRVPVGSLLLSFKLSIGKVVITDREVYPNEAIAWIRPSAQVDRDYLALALENVHWDDLGGRAVKGKTMNSASLDAVPLLLPPLQEQRRIVDLVAALDDTITAAQRQLDCNIAMAGPMIDYLLRGDADWPTFPLGEVGAFVRGRRFTKSEYVNEGLGCIHYGQVHTRFGAVTFQALTFLPLEAKGRLRLAEPGDVVVAATSEDVEGLGKATAWLGDEPVAVHDDCYIFKHDLDPRFASFAFRSPAFQDQKVQYAAGTKVTRISGDNLAKIRIPIPPHEAQQTLGATLSAVEAQAGALQLEINRLRDLRSNLLTALLSGEHEIPESYDELMEEPAA